MKKNILKSTLFVIIALLLLNSCDTLMLTPKKSTTTMVNCGKYTSVENLIQLKINSSLEDVEAALGSKPYNILSNQANGYMVCMYLYKIIDREVDSSLVCKKGGETVGTEVYNQNIQTAYLFFKNNTLEALVTTEGRKNSPLTNNSNYSLTKENVVIIPTTETNQQSVLPIQETKTDNNPSPLKSIFKKKSK